MRKEMDLEERWTRRAGRPTIRELALARRAAEHAKAAVGSGVDQLVAETVARLAITPSAPARARSARGTRTRDWTRDAR
jgi:hypothetical protein